MAGAALSTLRNQVIFRVDREDISDNIDLRINWAYQQLAHHLEIPELFTSTDVTLVTGQRNYNLTVADILKIMTVKLVSYEKLLWPLTLKQEAVTDESATGEPSRYLFYNNQFTIDPAPSSTYNGATIRIRYKKYPPRLTSSGDTASIYPEIFDELIVMGAVYKTHRDLQDPDSSSSARKEWMAEIAATRQRLIEEFNQFGDGVTILPSFRGVR